MAFREKQATFPILAALLSLFYVITLFDAPSHPVCNECFRVTQAFCLLGRLGPGSQQLLKPRQMGGRRCKPAADCEDRDDLIYRFEMILM